MMTFETGSVSIAWAIINELSSTYQKVCRAHEISPDSHSWVQFYQRNFDIAPDSALQEMHVVDETGADATVLQDADVRREWITKQMRRREDEFAVLERAVVHVGTWNVNSKKTDEDINHWLRVDKAPDIIAIGLQEIDMTAGALVAQETAYGKYWNEKLHECVRRHAPPAVSYVEVESKQLVGLFVIVFVRSDHEKFVTNSYVKQEAVGIMGMMGNKGGIAVRFDFHGTSLCFIGAHLAPHMNAVDRRNQNFHDIIENITFPVPGCHSAIDHDVIYWFGDLNYRIPKPDSLVKQLITEKKYDKLARYDQLTLEHEGGRVFEEFEEGPLTFAPTYKYDPETDTYDTSEKKRTPAWTDRILWRGSGVLQTKYDRVDTPRTSDHRPVYGQFVMEYKKIVEEKYTDVYMDVVKALDRLENEMLPECELSNNHLMFNDVMYDVPYHRRFVIRNSGQVVVQFHFIPKPDEQSICKPWLGVYPKFGMILPGESLEVRVILKVTRDEAAILNHENTSLDDILILHLKNGRDHFVSVQGNFLRSCFGNSLENLVRIHGAVRFTNPEDCTDAVLLKKDRKKLKIPKELWRIVDYLHKNAMEEEGLFDDAGDPQEIVFIMGKLDQNETLDGFEGSIHSVAHCLLQFLSSVSPTVVPREMYRRVIDSASSAKAARDMVSSLHPVHYNVFHYVTSFLRELLLHSDRSGLTTEKLAYVFSSVLLPQNPRRDSRKYASFMMHFLRESPPPPEKAAPGELLLRPKRAARA
eukprot:TRINITY_DN3701_c0_g1_i2.p1 TRINITY_DN3701_c0_g1~~TRINITY_DN3701_c0_g1_i2.p1  ORF type:complete len:754 (+),score=198.34 TRINITY_DN3701_c0_g1_i2:598-2859(+)